MQGLHLITSGPYDKMDKSNIKGRKRFAHDLPTEPDGTHCPNIEELLKSVELYQVESVQTCFKEAKNFYGMELYDRLDILLQEHLNKDNYCVDSIPIAIMFLISSKRDVINQSLNPKIKELFGNCPFRTLQEMHEIALKLKMEIPNNCLMHILKKSTGKSSTLWTSLDYETTPLTEIKFPEIHPHFYIDNKKPQKKNNSFSMALVEPSHSGSYVQTKKSNSLTLADYYSKYSSNLGSFSCDEFVNSMQQILSSSKRNEELQNELFEMLGFEVFELISALLDNRNELLIERSSSNGTTSKAQNGTSSLSEAEVKRRIDFVNRQTLKTSQPAVSSQVIVQSEEDKLIAKQLRKREKKERKQLGKEDLSEFQNGYKDYETFDTVGINDYDYENFSLLKSRALANISHPNIHDEHQDVSVKAMVCGQMANIPLDAIKKSTNTYDLITIPPKKSTTPIEMVEKIKVSDMDAIGQTVFCDIETFNNIQSEVYPIAYHTNENMLICAPTGAGKTNIALLTIVQQIKNFIEDNVLRLEKFKIVYVCPMKALANEMASNFSKKLLPLGVNVRELTGDMQLTRKEIAETQMLITTPEKWDVITRKGTTDAELTSLLKLLILDEVHLLNSDRGPVIEALVARTLRQVVNSQNMIRIIGLSATLPNYRDVSDFLRVNSDIGLFYFDSRYRSVPLTQSFVGVKGTKQSQQMAETDEVCFDKVIEFLRGGHQVMVFVHARNQTTKTANYLKETASKRSILNLFEPDKSFKSQKSITNNNNKLLVNFLPYGLGVHHAGMLRRDRNEVEKCFLNGAIKVLVCTATLAWGVNLPAHGVIIKGTKLYDSKRGNFVNLDVLDVMQIFGRAGRPQFDTSGHGIIVTTHDKMHFYLSALTNQIPIESKLLDALTDNLNAEIILGGVSNVQEAVEWMTFTYLYRRMKINPQVYGLNYKDLQDDPDLRMSMLNFIDKAAKLLDKARMIRYDTKSGDLISTNLGRTASYYYINFDTIEVFNELIKPSMTESDIISMMCLASEFQQIQVRQEELEDLDQLYEEYCELPVPGGVENIHGKVNILMQTYLSRGFIKSLSLASDMEYITQSSARIARALFDIAVHRNNALLAGRCLLVAQMFEQQLWPTQTPMRQFRHLDPAIMERIEKNNVGMHDLRERSEREVGDAIRNIRAAEKVKHCAAVFPSVEVDATVQPITRGVIRVKIFITPTFKWSTTYNGKGLEMFWIWVEDPDSDNIYHTETFAVSQLLTIKGEPIELVFTIPLIEPTPTQYILRISSDRWMHAVYTHPLSFLDLQLPASFTPHTDLLELQPLEVSALKNELYERLYSFSHFNPVQTQMFHCLYHSDTNVLLGAPTGSGKTIAAEICMFRLFNNNPHLKIVYIAPLKALVRERVDDWGKKFGAIMRKRIVEITGDVTPNPQAIKAANIIITTPEKWDGMSRGWQTRHFIREVGLMIIDEIHLLGEDRGPVLEVIVSRTNFIADRTGRKMRIIGLSTAMANARDLGTWLGIGQMGLYNFRPSVRPVPLEVHISGFAGKHYCPRMMSMNRPAYQAIRQYAADSPSLVFCSSRKQTRLTAFDLTTYLVTDADPKQWLHCDEDSMTLLIANILDPDLKQFLAFGIGIHHAGLQERDRKTVEELFVNHKIQVLIATGTLAWGVNFPAHLVVIKGTEYFDGQTKRYVDMPITDVLQMMGRAGRPQFDTSGVACVFVHDIKKNFYKKFLYEPFPVESQLLKVLPDHVNAEIASETVPTKSNLMEYLTWTYLFRRLLENPCYYNLSDIQPESVNQFLSELIDSVIHVLLQSNCVQVTQDENAVYYESTFYGQIASYYYLSHKTMLHFQNNLKPSNSIKDLLVVMCNAEEYALFPVRHNEDKINMELVKRLSLKHHGINFDSPHLKVQILMEMYLSEMDLPNQEYIVDLKSALDQSLRILQAMIDISTNAGWFACSIRVINLMQMIIQGRWISEPCLLTIPHMTRPTLSAFTREIKRNRELANCNADTLPGLKFAYLKHEKLIECAVINVYGSNNAVNIKKSVKRLPWVSLKLSLRCVETGTVQHINVTDSHGVEMLVNEEYEFVCEFNRQGLEDGVLQSCRFPKKKDEGWFICVGHSDELCSIKRASISRKCSSAIKIVAPPYIGNFTYALVLMSDSYLGLDQQYAVQVQVRKKNTEKQ